MKKIKVGFLPLYIKLYDDSGSDRTYMQAFYDRMAGILSVQGFDVIKTDFCRIKEEFKAAVEKFENDGADVIVTLHNGKIITQSGTTVVEYTFVYDDITYKKTYTFDLN